ncbi:MAG: DUF362 domain-containing protein [Bryobacterales bacterium]|nr:DUF362 domain-containing protein [Bryobacterales bacterium]
MTRREWMAALTAAMAVPRPAFSAGEKLGIPGPYPGRVVSVRHAKSIVSGAYQPEVIRQMMTKGMTELTGAPSWEEAWRVFIQPGDVVGIKVNPVGGRRLCSDPSVLHLIIEGIEKAGVSRRDIVVYDRYRREFLGVGFHRWLPEGVRFSWAAEQYDDSQLGLHGYDRDQFVELPLVKPGDDPADAHVRRSYLSRFLTQQVNKVINLPVLKHHQSAGVTLALKNLSHGMVNNVNRSHVNRWLNACNLFIPAVVEHPIIRQKVVLNILDGVKAGYNDGPGVSPQFIWEYHTMFFATDPVALDKTGWRIIDARRKEAGLPPVADQPPDDPFNAYRGQPEHIELASTLGLGVYDDARIDLRRLELG